MVYFPLVDLGGMSGAYPPMGPNSFVFAYIFTKRHPYWRSAPTSEVHALQQVHASLWEILDPPLFSDNFLE